MLAILGLIIHSSGLIALPIALISIAALTVLIERMWRLMPLRRRFGQVHAECQDALLHGGGKRALERLGEADPLSRVLRAGLSVQDHGLETVRAVAMDAAQREIPALERGLGIILMTTQVAPLLGLLGTVIGLIEAFQAAGTAEVVTNQVIANGVYQALGTTALGLLVAIPAFVAYSYLTGITARMTDQLEHAATDLPLLLKALR
jgi:biopolymer transport protein ExbB